VLVCNPGRKAKPVARRELKASDLIKGNAVFLLPEGMTMNRPTLPMSISARLLIFSYLKYLAHDPTFLS
jgi:hypothetical protein